MSTTIPSMWSSVRHMEAELPARPSLLSPPHVRGSLFTGNAKPPALLYTDRMAEAVAKHVFRTAFRSEPRFYSLKYLPQSGGKWSASCGPIEMPMQKGAKNAPFCIGLCRKSRRRPAFRCRSQSGCFYSRCGTKDFFDKLCSRFCIFHPAARHGTPLTTRNTCSQRPVRQPVRLRQLIRCSASIERLL